MLTMLRNLILALLNATLILLAVCLWLGVSLTDNLRSLTDVVDRGLAVVEPLRDDVNAARTEMANLRQDFAVLRNTPELIADEQLSEIVTILNRMDARLSNMEAEVTELANLPEEVLQTALSAAAARLDARGEDQEN